MALIDDNITISAETQGELRRRLRWLLLSRFVLFVVVFIAVLISRPTDDLIYYLLLLYGATTAGYLVALFKRYKKADKFPFRFLCGIPLALEILVEIVLVHLTGGVQSPYIFLIALSIVTAAFIYKLTGTLVWTAFASVLYSFMVWAEYKMLVEFDIGGVPLEESIYSNSDALFFSVYLFICFLFIIAFLSGYLSKKLQLQVKRIKDLDTEITQLKVRTGEIIEHLTNGVLVVNQNREISFFNNAAQQILDIDFIEEKNSDIKELLGKKTPELYNMIDYFINHENMRSYKKELVLERRAAKRLHLKVSINDLKVSERKRGIVIVLEDITSEKRRQTLIEQMEKLAAIGDISARFAHEIRNPLASIRGSVEMLMSDINLPPEDKRLFELVIKESDRLTNLLEDFLAFARLKELPTEQFTSGKVDIGEMLEEVVLMVRSHPDYHAEIDIKNKIKPGKVLIRGQQEQLGKAFFNMIINSFQAIGNKAGHITIDIAPDRDELFSDDSMIGITISDDGRGMDEKEIEKIYTPFFSSKKKGSGLGMAITNSVIGKHNGYMDVESEPGKGTTITIFLKKINATQNLVNFDKEEQRKG